MKNRSKVLAGGTALATTTLALANSLLDKYFKKGSIGVDELSFIKDESIQSLARRNRDEAIEWFQDSNKEEIFLRSYDGLRLHGFLIENKNTDNYIIFSHGMWSNLEGSLSIACKFERYGYNILVFDHRGCGKSEGEYSTIGYRESFDLIQWINYLAKNRPNSKICLHGVSMGAASVCIALGTKLPLNVKCAISDCSFSSLKEEIESVTSKQYHLPLGPISKIIDVLIKKKYGFSYKDVDPYNALKANTTPILFVHGTADDFVPFEMAKILYDASSNSVRKYYPVKDKGHGQACFDDNYYSNINSFIKEYLR